MNVGNGLGRQGKVSITQNVSKVALGLFELLWLDP